MVETAVGRALQSVLQRVTSAAHTAGRTQKVRPPSDVWLVLQLPLVDGLLSVNWELGGIDLDDSSAHTGHTGCCIQDQACRDGPGGLRRWTENFWGELRPGMPYIL